MDEANGTEYLVTVKKQEKASSGMKCAEQRDISAALKIKVF